MASREEIRAVFSDPQLDGMDELNQCIGEMLQDGADFENAYSLVIAAGDAPANTWIRFCVQCALKPNGGFDHILKADAHHTKVISTALLRNGRKSSNRDGRSQNPQGETTQNEA